MDIIDPGDPENPNDRAKASMIRRKVKRDSVTPEELAWLEEFEQKKSPNARGASAHRKVTFTEEESAAVGEGTASVAVVAAHAAMAREEGRREDNLADRGIRALERAFARQEAMVDFMMARMKLLEDVHLQMWDQNRDLRIKQAETEIEIMQREAAEEGKGDSINEMVTQLMPMILKRLNGSQAKK
jgi:hypothetical protein